MSKYRTYNVEMTIAASVTVEAKSKREAKEKALNAYEVSEFDRRVDRIDDLTPPPVPVRRGIGSY